MKKYATALLVILFLALQGAPTSSTANTRPTIGVIRWDAWCTGCPGSYDETALAPVQWRDRIPFYSQELSDGSVQIRLDSQNLMDQEIAAAKAGGIDYWAFDYYGDSSNLSNALKFYLASTKKSDVKFALVLTNTGFTDLPGSVAKYFKDPQYQTVLSGRPLLYAFSGTSGFNRAMFDAIRNNAKADGLSNPYIVWMTGNANDGLMAAYGLDAVSSYALVPSGGHDDVVVPYSNLTSVVQNFWNNAKSLGMKVIPLASTGWDPRPRWVSPPPWDPVPGQTAVTTGSPSEIANHIKAAADWNAANPTVAETNNIIIYAWNEFAEGGWLTPLLNGGSARLDAIRQVMGVAAAPPPPIVSGVHPNGTLVLDGQTVWLIKNQTRFGFRDSEEYRSHGYNFNQVVTATNEDKALPQASGTVKALEGSLVLDASDNRTIYMIGLNGTKRGFASENVFKSLGYNFNNLFRINLNDYPTHSAIADAALPHPDGALVSQSNGTVWWLRSNMRQGFESEAVFNTYGFSFAKVVPANSADLSLAQGALVKFRDGTLVRDNNNYYIISDGQKLKFGSSLDLTNRGYKLSNVINASLAGYESGGNVQ